MTITAGQTVTIEGHRCRYRVWETHAVEGGLWALRLLSDTVPVKQLIVEVQQGRDDVWRTEQLEVVAPIVEAQVPKAMAPEEYLQVLDEGEREEQAPRDAGQLSLF